MHVLRHAPPRAVFGVERVLAQVHEGDGALHALQGTRLEAHGANGDGEPMLQAAVGGVFIVAETFAMRRRRCGGTASGAVVGLAQSHEGQAPTSGIPLWAVGSATRASPVPVFVVGSPAARRRWRAGRAGRFIVRFDGPSSSFDGAYTGIERDTIRLRRVGSSIAQSSWRKKHKLQARRGWGPPAEPELGAYPAVPPRRGTAPRATRCAARRSRPRRRAARSTSHHRWVKAARCVVRREGGHAPDGRRRRRLVHLRLLRGLHFASSAVAPRPRRHPPLGCSVAGQLFDQSGHPTARGDVPFSKRRIRNRRADHKP